MPLIISPVTLAADNLSGTIPSTVLQNSSLFIGTTSIALNRASASQTLSGISIDGNAGTVTGGVYTSGDQTIGGTKTFSSMPALTSTTGNLVFPDSGTTKRGLTGTVGGNDFWFLGGGATATNAGFLEISTGDDGTEPIYVRQYSGSPLSGTITRTLTLLDGSGNTTFPGSISAVTKSFLIDHPTKNKMKLRYGSLEGPEHGVYVRGKVKGIIIELPDYWTKLIDPNTITVQLTAIGKNQKLYVKDISNNKVYIANDGIFSSEPECFYLIQAERIDIDKLITEVEQ